MRSIFIVAFVLLLANIAIGQPIVEDIISPRYVQGVASGTATKVPYVCYIKIKNLTPSATYTYYARLSSDTNATSANNGDGYPILVKGSGFKRVTAVSVSPSNANAGKFTTNATGEYTGWFACETLPNATFTPGVNLYFRVMMNNGAGGLTVNQRAISKVPVKVINFGSTASDGAGIRSTPATGAAGKDFVVLYDEQNIPVSGTFVEGDGAEDDNSLANGYVDFYANSVNNVSGAWGNIIPNNLANGVRKIVRYDTTGATLATLASTDGRWPTTGGTWTSTASTAGTTIILDGTVARLDGQKNTQSISFAAFTNKTYGDADIDPAATASSGDAITYSSSNTSVATIVNGQVHITGAGTTNITAVQAGNGFYNAAPDVVQTLTVDKKQLTVTGKDVHMLQGAAVPALEVLYSGFVNGEEESVLDTRPTATTTATSASVPGTYPVTPGNGTDNNYSFSYVAGTLTVDASSQPQTITFGTLPVKTYGDADFDAGATINSTQTIQYTSDNAAVATIVNGKVHITGAGTANIKASQPGGGSWLPAADVVQPLTVNKAPLTIGVADTSRLMGAANPVFRILYSGFVNGENSSVLTALPVAATTADVNSVAGTYAITVSGAAAANYTVIYTTGTLTILPLASQTITFAALPAKKYGDNDFLIKPVASSGLKVTVTSSNPAVATIEGDTLVHIISAGTTVITATQAGNSAYAKAEVAQPLTVQKVYLYITANNAIKKEGEPVPALTLSYKGFVKGEDSTALLTRPTVTTTATAQSIPGTYPITVQGATAVNYNIALINGTLSVLPAQGELQDNLMVFMSSPTQLQVNVYAVAESKGVVQLFDQNGTRLVNVPVTFVKGFGAYKIPVGNVTRGVYHVRVSVGGTLLKQKIIIQ